MPGEGVGGLEERRGMTEGAEPSLLGEQLLVGHWIDGVMERKRGAARSERESQDLYVLVFHRKDEAETVCVDGWRLKGNTRQRGVLHHFSHLRPPTRCPYELLAAELERELLM